MTTVRHAVRAILFDGDDVVLFRRVRPEREPYWVTPGGGVEPGDPSLEAALRRELDEELGATAGPALHVFTLAEPGRLSTVFACRLVSLDLSRRSGPEFLEPDIGLHQVRRVRPADVRTLNVVPPELGEFISASAATLPALLDAATYAPGRYRPVVDVHLLVTDGDRVLLGRRHGTGYADGEWQIMPSGHLEEGETAVDATIREAREELGIDPYGCEVVHVMHHRNPGGTARVGLFLVPGGYTGTPVNAEPHKCAELGWFPMDRLPERTVPYARAGVEAVRRALAHGGAAARSNGSGPPVFSLHGWERPGAAEAAAEAARSGFEEVTVCLVGWLDGTPLVRSDEETDRLPATVVRPGEDVEAALARIGADGVAGVAGETWFAGADDYVSPDGRPGRRLAFAARLTTAPEGLVSLPAGSLGRLPYAEGAFVRSSGLLYRVSDR
ncbi:NUDIX domain-containing protein [Microbispora amethystogenes]|uniref:NUDIX domain-containing protein n=1 Tax=Microbispora amethystogenes TaxID=1427754 RepID=UPI0033FF251C